MPLDSFMRRRVATSSLSKHNSGAFSKPSPESPQISDSEATMGMNGHTSNSPHGSKDATVCATVSVYTASDEDEEASSPSNGCNTKQLSSSNQCQDIEQPEDHTDESLQKESESEFDDADEHILLLQHLTSRITTAKARHGQQVTEATAEIDKMRTALKRYVDGLMDQLQRDFVDDPDTMHVSTLDELQNQCAELARTKRKIAYMGATWERKAKLVRKT